MHRSTDRVFAALGDPVRRFVLQLLATEEQHAGAVVAAVQAWTPISQPAVSQHLKVLRDAGLVQVRAEGTRRRYALDEDAVREALAFLHQLLDPVAAVEQPLDALATEVARGRRARRRTSGDGRDSGVAG